MLKIEQVKEGGSAEKAGLKRHDALVSIYGNPIRDVIDFMYHSDGETLRGRVKRDKELFDVSLKRDGDGEFGLRLETLKPLTCSNKCVFCFIDQLPGGMRETLYVKDEDYRLSFLHGNFITMTNLGPAVLKRIVEQNLSPLYVSVHTTDPSLRARMLGVRSGGDVLSKLQALKNGGVRVHAQIVLCPSINDGGVLEKTVSDLAELFPSVATVAIVPVGLTKFRSGLPTLQSVDRAGAERVLESVDEWQRGSLERTGSRFVFAADEFYILAGEGIPSEEEYEGYPQLENGVGLVRLFLEQVDSLKRRISRRSGGRPVVVLTGRMAEPVLAGTLSCDGVRVLGVTNGFLGETVTVSGLLTGKDLSARMEDLRLDEIAVLPENCINHEGLFLDGSSPGELEKSTGRTIILEGLGDSEIDSSDSWSAKRGKVHAFQ
jgi:putative radical SAM enzyme (TIGR03279 family)